VSESTAKRESHQGLHLIVAAALVLAAWYFGIFPHSIPHP
jgi:hypothetical protein